MICFLFIYFTISLLSQILFPFIESILLNILFLSIKDFTCFIYLSRILKPSV